MDGPNGVHFVESSTDGPITHSDRVQKKPIVPRPKDDAAKTVKKPLAEGLF